MSARSGILALLEEAATGSLDPEYKSVRINALRDALRLVEAQEKEAPKKETDTLIATRAAYVLGSSNEELRIAAGVHAAEPSRWMDFCKRMRAIAASALSQDETPGG